MMPCRVRVRGPVVCGMAMACRGRGGHRGADGPPALRRGGGRRMVPWGAPWGRVPSFIGGPCMARPGYWPPAAAAAAPAPAVPVRGSRAVGSASRSAHSCSI